MSKGPKRKRSTRTVDAAPRDAGAAGLGWVRPSGMRWREALLSTVAAGALSFAITGGAQAGPDACATTGTVATCTGNQSAGIASSAVPSPDFLSPPVSTLNVNNLTHAIDPASGTLGIFFVNTTGVTLTSDTGNFGITTTGDFAHGILARAYSGFSTPATVTVTSTGNITTAGNAAYGIAASSAGYTSTGPVSVISIGNITTAGSGARGIDANSTSYHRNAGTVTVTSTGTIATQGGGATGISATSHAAYGSAAAVTVTSTGNIATQGAGATGVKAGSIGYSGSAAVTVNSTGNIVTAGSGSLGIQASSTTYNGNTGAVTVTSTGNITTAGAGARGINAYSFSVNGDAAAVTLISTGNITTQGVGATGIRASSASAYGSAGTVTVTSTGNISTQGNGANGILAVNSGYSHSGAVTVSSTGNIATVASGAQGISATSSTYNGNAGAVTITSTGNITTAGGDARGIDTRSYSRNGNAGAVTVTSTGNIVTAGIGSSGIHASAFANNGSAGAVTVTSTGNITTLTTHGAHAYGIYARSAGYDNSGAVTVSSTGNIATAGNSATGIVARSASGYGSGAVTVTSTGNIATAGANALGIDARSGAQFGSAGAVTVTSAGNIITQGNGAHGIYAVSAGYGAAAVVSVTSTGNVTTSGSSAAGIIAVSASYNGNAGAVTVTSIGNITATGGGNSFSGGIVAISSGYAGSGAVTVTSTGNIITTGSNASGIAAYSYSNAVKVTSTGNITAQGANASGILAASYSGPITVTINSGTVSGGGGAGVAFQGGTANTLTNMGTVMALSGLAIFADTGNTTVSNFGTVTGSVILGGVTNAFNNQAGGLFNTGAIVDLGAGNTLANAGTLSPGGAGLIQTTTLNGNLTQSATGILFADINLAGATSDLVNVSGAANLSGAVQVHVLNPQLGAFQQTILSAAGGTTVNGLSLLASPALQAQLVYPNADDVVVKSSGINFLTPGLSINQASLGNALNGAAQNLGLGGPVFNLLLNGVTTPAGYGLVLNQLSGEVATGVQQTTVDAMTQFLNLLLDPSNRGDNISTPGGGANGFAAEGETSAYAADGRKRTRAEQDAYAMFTKAPLARSYDPRWSVWAAGFGGSQTTDGNALLGSNTVTSRIAAGAVGADYRFSPNTVAGFALAGGGTSFILANGLGAGRSDLFQAGAYFRHTAGAAYITGALAYGWQDVTTNRTLMLAGLDQLQARFNVNAFSGRLEGGYRFVSPWMGVGITPYAAGQFTTFDLPAYAEQALIGSNAFALQFGARDVTAARSELGFRTDKSWVMPNAILTLRSRLAWAHDYDTDRSIGATFQTLPGASFVVGGAAQAPDKALTTVAAEVKWRNGFSLSGVFEGEFASNVRSYAGKAVARFQW
jgi:uncharacterized protein with beta-barrel porin domain